MTTSQTEQDYLDSLKAMRPVTPPDQLPEGGRDLDANTQGLIEQQMGRGAYNPGGLIASQNPQRMEGVGKDYGLIGTSHNDMGMSTPDDFNKTLDARSRDAVAGTVQKINAADKFMEPMRRARQQAQSSANLAKEESLRFNNWTLKQTQELQKLQLQQAQEAMKKNALSSILGLGAMAIGTGVAAATGVGLPVALGIGAAAGSVGKGTADVAQG